MWDVWVSVRRWSPSIEKGIQSDLRRTKWGRDMTKLAVKAQRRVAFENLSWRQEKLRNMQDCSNWKGHPRVFSLSRQVRYLVRTGATEKLLKQMGEEAERHQGKHWRCRCTGDAGHRDAYCPGKDRVERARQKRCV